MSKKKQKKNDVKSAILVLLLIAILLIASTYAWFTANTNVEISTLNVNVGAANGLQISADGTNWKTVLTNTDIDPTNTEATGIGTTYTSNINQIPTIMEPVSTVGEMATDGTMKMFSGRVTSSDTGDLQLVSEALTDKQGVGENAGKYIAFDVFLKVDEDSMLSLTKDSNASVKQGETSKGLEYATRTAFCVLGNTTAGASLETIQALNTDATSHIWEPNYDSHTATGVANAKDNYGITTTTPTATTAVEYYGVKAPIETAVPLASTDANYFEKVTPEYQTKTTVENDVELFQLKAGITKVRIYMWVEGQDVDCENTASGSNIAFNVKFSIPAKANG